MSPTRMRRLTAAVALEAITLCAGEPDSVVTAIVVRTRAAGSAPAARSARLRSGCTRRALANSGRSGAGACGAIRANISIVGSGSEAANCRFSRRTTARAIRAVGPPGAGVEEWPPRPSARSSIVVVPFSETPTTPSGGCTPGKAWCAIAPPSSSTNQGVTPRERSSSTAAGASGPETSSRAPKESHTSRGGHEPVGEQALDGGADADQRALVVEGAAAPDRAVVDLGAEGWVLPGGRLVDRHDVDVGHQHDGIRRGPALPVEEQRVLEDAVQRQVLVQERERRGQQRDELLERADLDRRPRRRTRRSGSGPARGTARRRRSPQPRSER